MAKQKLEVAGIIAVGTGGKSKSDAGMRKQALTLLELARRHAPELRKAGFTEADIEALRVALERYDAARSARRNAREEARQLMVALESLVTKVRIFRRKLVAALKLLSKRGVPIGKSVLRLGRTAETPARLLAWLVDVRQLVDSLQKRIASCLEDALPQLDELHAKLGAAFGEQQANRRSDPALTTEIHRQRSEVSRGMDELRIAAAIAFAERRELLRQFKMSVDRPTQKDKVVLPAQPAANDAVTDAA